MVRTLVNLSKLGLAADQGTVSSAQLLRFSVQWTCVMLLLCCLCTFMLTAKGLQHSTDARLSQNGRPKTGAFQEWKEGRVTVGCHWDLREEKDLVSVTLTRKNMEENIFSLDFKTEKCDAKVNYPAMVKCEMTNNTVTIYADIEDFKNGESRTYVCKRIYYDWASEQKEKEIIVTKNGTSAPDLGIGNDGSRKNLPVAIVVPVVLLVFVFGVVIGVIVMCIRNRYNISKCDGSGCIKKIKKSTTPEIEDPPETSGPETNASADDSQAKPLLPNPSDPVDPDDLATQAEVRPGNNGRPSSALAIDEVDQAVPLVPRPSTARVEPVDSVAGAMAVSSPSNDISGMGNKDQSLAIVPTKRTRSVTERDATKLIRSVQRLLVMLERALSWTDDRVPRVLSSMVDMLTAVLEPTSRRALPPVPPENPHRKRAISSGPTLTALDDTHTDDRVPTPRNDISSQPRSRHQLDSSSSSSSSIWYRSLSENSNNEMR